MQLTEDYWLVSLGGAVCEGRNVLRDWRLKALYVGVVFWNVVDLICLYV